IGGRPEASTSTLLFLPPLLITDINAQLLAGPPVFLGQSQHFSLLVGRQPRDRGMRGPAQARTADAGRHAASDRLVALEHVGRNDAFAGLRKGLARPRIPAVQ